jgi:hypothetical protein
MDEHALVEQGKGPAPSAEILDGAEPSYAVVPAGEARESERHWSDHIPDHIRYSERRHPWFTETTVERPMAVQSAANAAKKQAVDDPANSAALVPTGAPRPVRRADIQRIRQAAAMKSKVHHSVTASRNFSKWHREKFENATTS